LIHGQPISDVRRQGYRAVIRKCQFDNANRPLDTGAEPARSRRHQSDLRLLGEVI
jgi:hypothetical protein